AGYFYCRVRPYVANPQRWFWCQRAGHGSRNCHGSETCATCGLREHVTDVHEETDQCIKFTGAHPALSRTCPVQKQEKQIQTFTAKENLQREPTSEFDPGDGSPAPRSEFKATQISPEGLATKILTPNPPSGLRPIPSGQEVVQVASPRQDRPTAAIPLQTATSSPGEG
ncbi:hypothetical protein HPB47_010976, partial [Ixodes persulcatus]